MLTLQLGAQDLLAARLSTLRGKEPYLAGKIDAVDDAAQREFRVPVPTNVRAGGALDMREPGMRGLRIRLEASPREE